MSKFKVLVTTIPFAQNNKLPLEILEKCNVQVDINPLGRKLKEEDLYNLIDDYDGLVAGTELISQRSMLKSGRLKIISRVGVGLDGVDLNFAKQNDIKVSYTPEAPAPAVAELTIGLMMNELRHIGTINSIMHEGSWKRLFGRRIEEVSIGLIGLGRIGSRVFNILKGFGCKNIYLNDLEEKKGFDGGHWVNLDQLLVKCDVVSLHVPLTTLTKDLITKNELQMMKKDAVLINTARGGIVNEEDLYNALESKEISSAAIDVFDEEPYEGGKLSSLNNCTLTSHMGSMSIDCRERMEIEACEEIARFVSGDALESEVPNFELELQAMGKK